MQADRALFGAVDDEQQAAYQREAEQRWDAATVRASARRWQSLSRAERQHIADEGNRIYADLLAAMPAGASAPEVQACVQRWRRHIEYFWTPNDAQLLSLTDLYVNDPRFRANYDRLDPRLAEFLREAVRIYVEALPR
ncbi:MAG: hypothetical protein GX557_09460 [Chloroflexi bacterium]|nr:hypothetical protein [Chloroflexota bacterium]